MNDIFKNLKPEVKALRLGECVIGVLYINKIEELRLRKGFSR